MKNAKVTNFSTIALWLLLAVAAVVTRFYDLGNKPIHFDESINGWFVMQMQNLGYYKYDPSNYHGPLYFYLLQAAEVLWGRSLEVLRVVPSVFSVLSVMIFTFGVLRSRPMQKWLSFFILLSPAFLFFGRSGIHEMPFVFFQIVFALGVLRWWEQNDSKALGLMMVGLFGMTTLKETFVITLFCWGVALIAAGPSVWRTVLSKEKFRQAWNMRLTFLFLFLLFLFAVVFTGYFRHMAGLVDFVRAFLPWMNTGVQGHGHEKPFWYWLQVLWQAEPLVLLGVVVACAGVVSKNTPLRVMSVFSLAQLLIYSVIPYKTVWCVLTLVWGFYFVLALTLAEITAARARLALWACVGILTGLGLNSAYASVYRKPLQLEHPYIYVNSTYELQKLQDVLLTAAKNNPEILREYVQIGMKEQWPWPWILRSFTKMDYSLCTKHILENAVVYFCDRDGAYNVEHEIHEPYWKVELTLRQARDSSLVYLKKSVFPEIPFTGAETVGEEEE